MWTFKHRLDPLFPFRAGFCDFHNQAPFPVHRVLVTPWRSVGPLNPHSLRVPSSFVCKAPQFLRLCAASSLLCPFSTVQPLFYLWLPARHLRHRSGSFLLRLVSFSSCSAFLPRPSGPLSSPPRQFLLQFPQQHGRVHVRFPARRPQIPRPLLCHPLGERHVFSPPFAGLISHAPYFFFTLPQHVTPRRPPSNSNGSSKHPFEARFMPLPLDPLIPTVTDR